MKSMKSVLAFLLALAPVLSPAQPATPLTDSDSSTGLGRATTVTMGSAAYFPWCGALGCELWRSDGTAAGTYLVKDIEAGAGSSSPSGLTVVGSTLFFAAWDAVNGRELWKTDGTLAGTVLVRNIASGATSSSPSHLTAYAGRLLFSAYESSSYGTELWTSSGTSGTTTRVADIYAGGTSSSPEELTAVGGFIYFSAEHATYGRELWRTDGTLVGTTLVTDLVPGAGWSEPRHLTTFGSSLLFVAHTATTGNELFIESGGGAQLVKDIFTGTGSSDPSELTVAGSWLYFSAKDGTDGQELWRSDGTGVGTMSVKNIRAGIAGSYPREIRVSGPTIFFTADDGVSGYELWKTDGTTLGTTLVTDLLTGSSPSSPTGLEAIPYGVVFSARGSAGAGLYRSNGEAQGTLLIGETLASTFGEMDETARFGTSLFVSAFSGSSPRNRLSVLAGSALGALTFTASNTLVNPGGASTLQWSAPIGATLTLNGAPVGGPSGSQGVNPTVTTVYTLASTLGLTTTTATVTIYVNDGAVGLGVPSVTSPSADQTVVVTGVGFSWTTVPGASGYDVTVLDRGTGALLSTGSLSGGTSTSTLISLPAGSYRFAVRACSGGFGPSHCGSYGSTTFTVSPAAPTGAPTVTAPVQGTALVSSTQTLAWTAVTPNPALPDLSYEVMLRDITAGTTALQITVPSPALSTIFTMKSSTQYELKVRACQAGCGPWSAAVTFSLALPPVPAQAPQNLACVVNGGNSLTCDWSAVPSASAYEVQVIQPPPAGPGGGALAVAAKLVSATTVTLPVPIGNATVLVAACNGDGCGPTASQGITASGPNPSQPTIGTPTAGSVVSGPAVLLTWNRIPGDNGSNTSYRLYVQDLSRQSAALDVFTTGNFYSAFFKAEGARYDALVIANPGTPGQITGPAQGFNVSGSSATAPTMVSPTHNGTVSSGNIQLGWSPVPGATVYEYFVAVLGQSSAAVRGVAAGLVTQVPLTGTAPGTLYSAIVRACPAGATCVAGSDAGWGPWSNAPGGPGVTNFTVIP
jgi:ELWxxDGT repeat protein